MSTAPDPLPERFVGWHRTGSCSPWRIAVEADTEDEAWAALLSAVDGGDKTVLPQGQDPNRRRPRPR
jgi:hypothetical protein